MAYDRYARGGDNPWRLDPGPIMPVLDMPKTTLPKTAPLPPRRPPVIDLTKQIQPDGIGQGLGGDLGTGADDWGAPTAPASTPATAAPATPAPATASPIPPPRPLPPTTAPLTVPPGGPIATSPIGRIIGANPGIWNNKIANPTFLDFLTGGIRGR
jgi:hypothetical protein